MNEITRIGVIGTGYVARGLVRLLENYPGLVAVGALTRRDINQIEDFPRPDLLTNSVDQVIEKSDLIVECTGDVIHGTEVVDCALKANLPVVTMDAELHVTTGSYFIDKGLFTEAEGDQPGSQAALGEEAQLMGFSPLVYGNIKGFLNRNPEKNDMLYWAAKQGISLEQVISWTDGTKLQVEQALVANGLDADIAVDGLMGVSGMTLEQSAVILGAAAQELGKPISDYILSRDAPPGIFIVATHDQDQRDNLQTYKMGDGPYYLLVRPYHLRFFEIPKTIFRVLEGKGSLLDNSLKPRISVVAVAKRTLEAGTHIKRGIGSFDVRGEAVRIAEHPDSVPIGLLASAVVKEKIEPGQIVTFADIDLPDSLALEAWLDTRKKAVGQA